MMNAFFEANLAKLAKTCAKSSLIIPNVETNDYTFCLTEQGELNVKKKQFFFHPQTGAFFEAEQHLKPLLKEGLETLYCFGLGLGYSYFVARNWLQQNSHRKLVYLEDDLSLLKLFLQTERASEVLSDKQVRLVVIDSQQIQNKGPKAIDGAEVLIERCRTNYSITALPSYWKAKADFFRKVLQGVKTTLFTYSNRLLEEIHHDLLAKNFYHKLVQISEVKQLDALHNAFVNIPSLVIGAGPSLEKELPKLKQLEDRALFFGAGSALNVLNTHCVNGHFGAGVDPTSVQTSRVKTNTAFETPFFYTNRFSEDAFKHLHGTKVFTPQVPEKKWYHWFQEQLGISNPHLINTGFSTSNYCTSVALYLGCNPIIFLGLDMAFSEEAKYVSGVHAYPGDSHDVLDSLSKHPSNVITITNVEGRVFETTLTFLYESSWVTKQAKEHPNTRFIYGSQEGFGANRVERMPLDKIRNQYLERQYDLLNHIHCALENAGSAVFSLRKVIRVLRKWKVSLVRTLRLLQNLVYDYEKGIDLLRVRPNAYPYPFKAIFDEIALEKEPTFTHLLRGVEVAAKLLQMKEIIDFRYVDDPSSAEQFLFDLKIKKHCYRQMIKVGQLHLQSVREVLHAIRSHKSFGHKENQPFDQKLLILNDSILCQKLGVFDPAFIPQGYRRPSGHETIREIHLAKEGTLEGECLQFYPNGAIKSQQFYENNLLHGPSTFFSQEGTLLAKSWFCQGRRIGTTYRFFKSGQLAAIERWEEGLQNGKQEYFYQSGHIKTLLDYHEGLLNGKVELFYPDGQLKMAASFIKGARCGLEERYYESGRKASQIEFKNNQPINRAYFWYENGRKAKELTFVGEKQVQQEWDRNGNELAESSTLPSIIQEGDRLKQSIRNLMNGK
ncbi:MAG: 6-hydroxymethylpterin diphosphokinase MptE-like protein [Parachlamydiaceae bacterium]